ncbi:MAG: hypothetical protein WDN45_09200 [Caulobacteraceae bacterium]
MANWTCPATTSACTRTAGPDTHRVPARQHPGPGIGGLLRRAIRNRHRRWFLCPVPSGPADSPAADLGAHHGPRRHPHRRAPDLFRVPVAGLPAGQRNLLRPPASRRETGPNTWPEPLTFRRPRDHDSTHYFILHGWNFGQDDPELAHTMREGLFAAFQEDVEGLSLVQNTLAAFDTREDFYELSVGSDAAAEAMRRWIKTLADRETVRT